MSNIRTGIWLALLAADDGHVEFPGFVKRLCLPFLPLDDQPQKSATLRVRDAIYIGKIARRDYIMNVPF